MDGLLTSRIINIILKYFLFLLSSATHAIHLFSVTRILAIDTSSTNGFTLKFALRITTGRSTVFKFADFSDFAWLPFYFALSNPPHDRSSTFRQHSIR
jgi:hypothetical protein